MSKLRRKLLSQNFLHSRQLVKKLVKTSSLGKNDLVLEIGPGRGIITEQLISRAQHVLAVELDARWYHYLQNKFIGVENLTPYQGDILTFPLPNLPYKVFSNPPFAIEGQIIRKIIDAPNPPEDCYLVVMKELAYRLSAPHQENQFALTHKPWFNFSIVHHFRPTDFTPFSNVDSVLFRFTKRQTPLLPESERNAFQNFIAEAFGHGLPLSHNLKERWERWERWERQKIQKVLNKLGLQKHTLPNRLPLSTWLCLYKELVSPVDRSKIPLHETNS